MYSIPFDTIVDSTNTFNRKPDTIVGNMFGVSNDKL